MLRKWLPAALFLSIGLFLLAASARADVKPHPLISAGMVLQQSREVKIWGTADKGEKVTVKFRDQETSTTADDDGRWLVRLQSKQAGGPFSLVIAGNNTITLENVLVGEVWICAGQSNMERLIGGSGQADKDSAAAALANPRIRMFTVRKNSQAAPVDDVEGEWIEANPQTVLTFSAVGYFFARDLEKSLNVPVGMIHTSWGGSSAELWTEEHALNEVAGFHESPDEQAKRRAQFKEQLAKYAETLVKNEKALAAAKAAGKPLPKLRQIQPPWSRACLYNAMLHPLLNYSIQGAIWYQGESDRLRGYEYRFLLPGMIKSWRAAWGVGDFPFYIVQLAPFFPISKEPTEHAWSDVCESQLITSKTVPNSGLAVIGDVGSEFDVHPSPKQPVGERLALLARARTYGENVVDSGPEYARMTVSGNKITLDFEHVGGGLQTRELEPTEARTDAKTGYTAHSWRVKVGGRTDAPLQDFTIAGADRKFAAANARIEGDKIVVSSDAVPVPVAVRYGWQSHPLGNLFNREGFPASPFRTDNWPLPSQLKPAAP